MWLPGYRQCVQDKPTQRPEGKPKIGVAKARCGQSCPVQKRIRRIPFLAKLSKDEGWIVRRQCRIFSSKDFRSHRATTPTIIDGIATQARCVPTSPADIASVPRWMAAPGGDRRVTNASHRGSAHRYRSCGRRLAQFPRAVATSPSIFGPSDAATDSVRCCGRIRKLPLRPAAAAHRPNARQPLPIHPV